MDLSAWIASATHAFDWFENVHTYIRSKPKNVCIYLISSAGIRLKKKSCSKKIVSGRNG
jgi:transposase